MQILFNGLLLGLAATLLYIAAFLYEDEERQLRNRLEEFWVLLDDASKRTLSRHGAFARDLAKRVEKFTAGRLSSPWSARSIWNAFWCAIAGPVVMHVTLESCPRLRWNIVVIALCVLVALAPLCRRAWRPSLLLFALAVGVIALPSLNEAFWGGTLGYVLQLPVAIVFLIAALRASIWSLKHLSKTPNAWALYASVILAVLLLLVLWFPVMRPELLINLRGFEMVGWLVLGGSVGALPLGSIPLLTTLSLIALLPLHQLAWGCVQRPTYAVARHGLLANRKLLVATALTLLGLGGHEVASGVVRDAYSLWTGK